MIRITIHIYIYNGYTLYYIEYETTPGRMR